MFARTLLNVALYAQFVSYFRIYLAFSPLLLQVPMITEGHVRRKVHSTLREKIRLQPKIDIIYRHVPRDNVIKTGYKTVVRNYF